MTYGSLEDIVSWRYAVVKRGKKHFAIHEVYHSESGKLKGMSENAVAAESETYNGVVDQLQMMLADALKYQEIDAKLAEGKWKKERIK